MSAQDHWVEVQNATSASDSLLPSNDDIQAWVANALLDRVNAAAEVTVRIVDRAEMQELNEAYRGKEGATNVLSFPFELDAQIPDDLLQAIPLGDIVICHDVVVGEAAAQHKELQHHYAHILTHGTLHLLGFDHQEDRQAQQMETLEISLLERLNIPNPYV